MSTGQGKIDDHKKVWKKTNFKFLKYLLLYSK